MKKRLIVLKQWFNKFKKLILTVAIVKYSITLVVIVILYFISRKQLLQSLLLLSSLSFLSCNFNIVSLHRFLIYECILGLLHPYGCFIRVEHSALNHLTPLNISRASPYVYVRIYTGSPYTYLTSSLKHIKPNQVEKSHFLTQKFIFCWFMYVLYMFIIWYRFNMALHPICHIRQMELLILPNDLHL